VTSFRRYLAEFIGTFIVVFIAAGAIVADIFLTRTRLADSFGPLGIVAAYGLAVAIAMLAVMPISGAHLNPVLSISAYVARRLSLTDTAWYVVAQVAGGVVAAFLLRGIMPKSAFDFASGGVPGLATGVSVLQGTAIEVVLTFFLAFTFWAVFVDERGPRMLAPFAVGLVVVVGGLAGSAFTGAAMNPVRWLGPALAGPHVSNWLIWTVGPLLGGLLGSLAYETLFLTELPLKTAEESLEPDDDDEEEEEEELVIVEISAPVVAMPVPVEPPPPAPPAEPSPNAPEL
jgi:MIP family channel proteins